MGDEVDEPDSVHSKWWMEWLRLRVLRVTNWMLRQVGIRRDETRRISVSDVMRGVRIRDMMTHRTDICFVDVSEDASRVVKKCVASDVTNWLVTEQWDRDRIVGKLDLRKLVLDVMAGQEGIDLVDYTLPVDRLLDANTVSDVLEKLIVEEVSLVVLMDEYGGTAGIVTKSDVMRELYERLRRQNNYSERKEV